MEIIIVVTMAFTNKNIDQHAWPSQFRCVYLNWDQIKKVAMSRSTCCTQIVCMLENSQLGLFTSSTSSFTIGFVLKWFWVIESVCVLCVLVYAWELMHAHNVGSCTISRGSQVPLRCNRTLFWKCMQNGPPDLHWADPKRSVDLILSFVIDTKTSHLLLVPKKKASSTPKTIFCESVMLKST